MAAVAGYAFLWAIPAKQRAEEEEKRAAIARKAAEEAVQSPQFKAQYAAPAATAAGGDSAAPLSGQHAMDEDEISVAAAQRASPRGKAAVGPSRGAKRS